MSVEAEFIPQKYVFISWLYVENFCIDGIFPTRVSEVSKYPPGTQVQETQSALAARAQNVKSIL